MRILFKLIAYIPFWVLYPIGDLLSFLARIIYRKKVVKENLRKVFPEKTEKQLNIIRRKFYRNVLNVMIEVVKTDSLSADQLKKRIKLVNPEVLQEVYDQKKPVLMFASHQGNWEWASHAISLHSPYKIDPIYKKQKSEFFDSYMYSLRAKYGGSPIIKEKAVRNIIKNKEKLRAVGILGDQRPFKKGAKVWLKFLGIETPFFPGGMAMPYMTQSPCYFIKVNRIKRGYYNIEAVKIGEPPYPKNDAQVLKNYANEIEKQIMAKPEDWLWSHKRWKYTRTNEEELLS